MKIKNIHAIEILDSRGIPTISTEIELYSEDKARGDVPSGASTGENEVLELRDGEKGRYKGKGVLKAIENVNTVIKQAVVDVDFESQKHFDDFLIQLDGTPNKSKIGGNAILSCSMAFCRACSQRVGLQLYQYLGMIYWGEKYSEENFRLPRPQILLMEGGKHGNWSTDIQEYMIIPNENSFPNFRETLRAGSEIFHTIHDVLDSKGYSVGVGYEGAFAPREIQSNKEALDILVEGIKIAGYDGKFAIALDVASSEFFNKESGKYELRRENKILSAQEWLSLQTEWYSQYPMYSIEDPMDQNAWSDWSMFTQQLGSKYQVVGDDLLVTNTKLIQKGMEEKSMNAVLIKLNQIGSVSETLDAIRMTVENGMNAVISHRSGETNDNFIADLVVGTPAQQSKFGGPDRGERLAKYNRLLEIEEIL
ncbi:MAG: phosphopyruvate hydratase [Candidatus Dojkabacteria bacterium]|jgi:enolase|nr:phosphopyruvate hydratase [Candidatus Dojkabacteria bacterium]